jgi:hypothetical protein
MKFKPGRQGSGYSVLTLFKSKLLQRDAYIIKYPTGSAIPAHKDPVPEGYVHWRLNIVLPTKHTGGDFYYLYPENPNNTYLIYSKTSWFGLKIIKFAPSEITHSVSEVISGTRYVLSFGWLKKR